MSVVLVLSHINAFHPAPQIRWQTRRSQLLTGAKETIFTTTSPSQTTWRGHRTLPLANLYLLRVLDFTNANTYTHSGKGMQVTCKATAAALAIWPNRPHTVGGYLSFVQIPSASAITFRATMILLRFPSRWPLGTKTRDITYQTGPDNSISTG
jgi:hypothetical protein